MDTTLRRWLRAWAAPAILSFLAACGGGNGPATPVAPAVTTQPASATVTTGQNATFSVAASGTDPLAYQWRRNGIDVAGATTASLTVTPAAGDNGALYTVVVSNAAGSATSNAATLTVNTVVAPAIGTEPAAVSVAAGSPATFAVVASGSGPLAYQWRRNASDIAGATSASYTLAAPALTDNGAVFSVRVTNAGGDALSANATLTVTAAVVAPAIATQPANQTVNAGQSATFSVGATGSAPLAYQWRRNGSDIAGATAASYTTAATIDADNGARLSVVVSNAAPTPATSSDAVLTVTPVLVAPAITTQPANASVNVGASATFSVVATGSAPLAYQWRKNGAPIAGANAASYTTPAVVAGDNGAEFGVVVSNSAGSATSNAGMLTVVSVGAAFPSRPLTLVVPFAAGSVTDALARRMATALRKQFGSDVSVSNVPGAGGALGAQQVANAAADGHTLLLTDTSIATLGAVLAVPGFDPVTSFDYLGLIDEMPLALVGRPTLAVNTYAELAAWMQANAGAFTIANTGVGGVSHLCSLAFQAATGIAGINVPYQGTAPALADVIGSFTDLLCEQAVSVAGQVQAGNVKAFGVTSTQPVLLPSMSGVPTLAQSGLAGFRVMRWHGLYAPRGTPGPTLAIINAALVLAMADPDVVSSEQALGSQLVTDGRTTPAGHRAFVQAEIERWRPLLRQDDPAVLSLLQRKNCLACHATVVQLVGPSWDAITMRYAAQPGAENYLVSKILAGGVGVWGAVPMPTSPHVSDAEARQIAQWLVTRQPTTPNP